MRARVIIAGAVALALGVGGLWWRQYQHGLAQERDEAQAAALEQAATRLQASHNALERRLQQVGEAHRVVDPPPAEVLTTAHVKQARVQLDAALDELESLVDEYGEVDAAKYWEARERAGTAFKAVSSAFDASDPAEARALEEIYADMKDRLAAVPQPR